MMKRSCTEICRLGAILVFLVAVAACGGEDSGEEALNPSEEIDAAVDQISEEQGGASTPAADRQPVPEMEQRCSDVSDQEIEEYAREYQRKMSSGEMQMITASERDVHSCWRYKLWLEGKVSDYGSGSPVM